MTSSASGACCASSAWCLDGENARPVAMQCSNTARIISWLSVAGPDRGETLPVRWACQKLVTRGAYPRCRSLSSGERAWRPTRSPVGAKRVDLITVGDMLAVLSDPWTTHPETARQFRPAHRSDPQVGHGRGYSTDDATLRLSPRHADKPQHRRAPHHSDVAAALEKIRARICKVHQLRSKSSPGPRLRRSATAAMARRRSGG